MKKIGLLGGSFDPPHKGHLFISIEAKKLLSLDEIWWLITPQNPLKIFKPASYSERLGNCHKIIKNYPIRIKEYEKEINSQYSFTTIKYLNNKFKFIKFYWLMGADNIIYFHNWQNWRKIFYEISIVVFKRHGYNTRALNSISKKTFSNFHINNLTIENFRKKPSWIFLNNREVKISSSAIRKQRLLLRGKN